jgi:hypothetical protein
LQASAHVVPASQERELSPPLHLTVHPAPEPHLTLQTALPSQTVVQPPPGQATLQFELPVQVRVEDGPTAMFAVAPPEMVTLLSAPASSEQVLVPAHVDTQSAAQLPVQVD